MSSTSEPGVAWVADGEAQLGFGVADERTAGSAAGALRLAGELAAGKHGAGPWFGGIAFPSSRGWPGFPAARFVRPERVEVRRLPGAAAAAAEAPVMAPMSDGWRVLVQQAVAAIGQGALEKVVLARAVEAAAPAGVWPVFEALCRAQAARHFLFRSADGAAFMGASPETLVRWRGARVELDALAGSAPVGGTFSEKERREHDVVVRDVVAALAGLEVERPAGPAVMKLPYVWHLHTPVSAATGADFDFARLLARLFPTSAVAGSPRGKAIELIAEHEGLERGWYAGAVGRIARGDVDLAVALRCLHVEGRTARLFAGAGIVAGSDAQAEWDETARKMSPARRALRGLV